MKAALNKKLHLHMCKEEAKEVWSSRILRKTLEL